MQSSKNSSRMYIPGLDGLRALAVVAVVLYHLAPQLMPGGFLGVDVFFVISGFLITTLLLAEKARYNKIALGKFWVRRARRLLPALFAVIIVTASLALLVGGDVLVGIGRQIFGAVTFSSNWTEVAAGTDYFSSTHPHIFLNFWSLAVEEQFYVVWPFVVLGLVSLPFFRRYRRSGLVMSLALAVGSAVWMALLFVDGDSQTRVYYGTDTHAFGLMIGAAIAFLSYAIERHGLSRRLMRPFVSVLRQRYATAWVMGGVSLAAIVASMMMLSDQNPVTYSGGMFAVTFLTGLLLISIVGRRTIWQRLFELAPLRWVGKRSYGLYLWHWPLFVLATAWLPSPELHWIAIVMTIVGTLVAATLSYRYIERPIQAQGVRQFLRSVFLLRTTDRDEKAFPLVKRFTILLAPICLCIGLTVWAVVTAPEATQAEISIRAGQQLVEQTKQHASTEPSSTEPTTKPTPKPSVKREQPRHPSAALSAVKGKDITLIGDSVSLASAPELVKAFPGIDIHAEVSEAFRTGGLDKIRELSTSGKLREVVIIAQATNGYYGTGNLERLASQMTDHTIILVTAYGDREWIRGNNKEARRIAAEHSNVVIAPWDREIKSHKDCLASDGIHPDEAGAVYYVRAIEKALTSQ